MPNEADSLIVLDGEGDIQHVVADIVETLRSSSSSGNDRRIFRPRNSSYGMPGFVVDPMSGQAIEIQRSVINASVDGENVLVNAVTDKIIMVIGLVLTSKSAVGVYFKSGGDVASSSSSIAQPGDAGGGDLPICFHPDNKLELDGSGVSGAVGGFQLELNALGYFGTLVGEGLVLTTNNGIGVGGVLQYVEVDPIL